MDETKVNARLPNLDIEIVRREYPEDHAEVMTVRMTATPSFQAVGSHLARNVARPLVMMWAAPMLGWAKVMETAWTPVWPGLARLTAATPSTASDRGCIEAKAAPPAGETTG